MDGPKVGPLGPFTAASLRAKFAWTLKTRCPKRTTLAILHGLARAPVLTACVRRLRTVSSALSGKMRRRVMATFAYPNRMTTPLPIRPRPLSRPHHVTASRSKKARRPMRLLLASTASLGGTAAIPAVAAVATMAAVPVLVAMIPPPGGGDDPPPGGGDDPPPGGGDDPPPGGVDDPPPGGGDDPPPGGDDPPGPGGGDDPPPWW